jgi:hypothetical protein
MWVYGQVTAAEKFSIERKLCGVRSVSGNQLSPVKNSIKTKSMVRQYMRATLLFLSFIGVYIYLISSTNTHVAHHIVSMQKMLDDIQHARQTQPKTHVTRCNR